MPIGTQVRTKKKPSSTSGPDEEILKDQTLRAAVKLPPGEDLMEWLAVNTVDFYNQTNMLYGILVQRCTATSCPKMSAGPRFEYLWADGKKVKQAISVSAPEYVEYLMTWVHEQLEDPSIFPSEPRAPFPKTFVSTVKQIFKRLFRVYAHIYHCHFPEVIGLKTEALLNTSFKHMTYFIQEFDLVSSVDLTPLQELIDTFGPNPNSAKEGSGKEDKEKQ
uniref:Uncharacterized protein n=1 Tax=Arcella intermedia TaxID=1963864 RepID=A0A6B2LGT4_9EUKA